MAWAAAAEEPKSAHLATAVRWDPHGPAAAAALQRLDHRGPEGWKTLAGLVGSLARCDPPAACRVAGVLAGGRCAKRLKIVFSVYRQVTDDDVRAVLALGLAHRFAEYANLLEGRLRKGGAEARALMARCAAAGMPDDTLERCLGYPAVALEAYALLRRRGKTPARERARHAARTAARVGLDPAACREFAAGPVDFDLLAAVADFVQDPDDDVSAGAHAVLLAASGKDQPADRDIWHSWVAARRDRPLTVEPYSPGAIAAAVVRGTRYLRRDLMPDGRCLFIYDQDGRTTIGSTALAVLALRTANVPADDPALRQALTKTLLVKGPKGRLALPEFPKGFEVYNASLLALALQAVDPKAYRPLLEALGSRIAHGQLANGRWTYHTGWGSAGGAPKHGGDNSNTQYAILGLRAVAAAGVEVDRAVWERNAQFWRETINTQGAWGYRGATAGHWGVVSMSGAGIGSLAICLEQLHGRDAEQRIRAEPVLATALPSLGRFLMLRSIDREPLYALYAVERACILTGTRLFKAGKLSYDWYRQGALSLLAAQNRDGSWGSKSAGRSVDGTGWGPEIDTAFALLFLKRATTPIGGRDVGGDVAVTLLPSDKPQPLLEPPVARKAPQPPALELDRDLFPTRGDQATVSGTLRRADAILTVDGKPVQPDEEGHFAAAVPVGAGREVAVAAVAPDGTVLKARARVARDTTPPELTFNGPAQCGPGRHVLKWQANETLSHLRVGGRVFCAQGRVVHATVELKPGKRHFTCTASDLAGNETKVRASLAVENRVLVLDGKSALGLRLKEHPPQFTLECWVRRAVKKGRMTVAGNIQHSGFAICWGEKQPPRGFVVVQGRKYLRAEARRLPPLNRWTHLALSYDGATASLFVNGKLNASSPGGPRLPSRHTFYIGTEPSASDGPEYLFTGAIDDVRLSSIARYSANFTPPKYVRPDRHTLFCFGFDGPDPFRDASSHTYAVRTHGTPRTEPERR